MLVSRNFFTKEISNQICDLLKFDYSWYINNYDEFYEVLQKLFSDKKSLNFNQILYKRIIYELNKLGWEIHNKYDVRAEMDAIEQLHSAFEEVINSYKNL